MDNYLFESKRLGFRNWVDDDLTILSSINSDPEVMKFFPSTQNEEASKEFIQRMKTQFAYRGYTYYAVDILDSKQTIGFIGLSWQEYESEWTPFVDIGWRLAKKHWDKGYATEGARRVLEFAFSELDLQVIYSVASKINLPSINVMQKIGMELYAEFNHPKLTNSPNLRECVLYRITK